MIDWVLCEVLKVLLSGVKVAPDSLCLGGRPGIPPGQSPVARYVARFHNTLVPYVVKNK